MIKCDVIRYWVYLERGKKCKLKNAFYMKYIKY